MELHTIFSSRWKSANFSASSFFCKPKYQRDYRTIHVWGELCSDFTWNVAVWHGGLCLDFILWLDTLLSVRVYIVSWLHTLTWYVAFMKGVCSVSRPSILIYCCRLQWTLHPDHVSWLDILQCIIHAYLPSSEDYGHSRLAVDVVYQLEKLSQTTKDYLSVPQTSHIN
jgi:hypothetical protein